MLDRRFALHAQVALRPEPFGALAYHYGTRRLVFLKHPDVLALLREMDGEATVEELLVEAEIDAARWPSFVRAIERLAESHMLTEVARAGVG